MITFKRYKNQLKVVPRGKHTIVQINGKPIAYLDDINHNIVELTPTSDRELKMLYYTCDTLGYSHKSFSSQTYEEKVNLKKLTNELTIC